MQLECVNYLCGSSSPAHAADWDSPRTLLLAFGPASLADNPEPLARLRERFPNSHILGCSTAGEILGSQVHDDALVVAAARFERTQLRTASSAVAEGDGYDAGRRLAQQLRDPSLRGVLVLADGLHVNGSKLARGLNESLPPQVRVSGGLAGDGPRFQRTWVLRDGAPAQRVVTAVGFYGEAVRLGHGCKGGWDVFGLERLVTRSEGNVLLELDGRPVLPLYKKYLGERAAELPASGLLFPLALRRDGEEKRIVRTVLAVDEARQALVFAGDVPEGSLAQLMKAGFDRLISRAGEAAADACPPPGQGAGPCLAVAVSCVGRRLVLGERTDEELESVAGALPPGSGVVGFYSYGELAPSGFSECDLHNQTMTLTTVWEA